MSASLCAVLPPNPSPRHDNGSPMPWAPPQAADAPASFSSVGWLGSWVCCETDRPGWMELETFDSEGKVVQTETEKGLGDDCWNERVEAWHLGDCIKKGEVGDLGCCINRTGSQSLVEMEWWFSKVRSTILLFVQALLNWLASSANYQTCFPLLVDSRLSILRDTQFTPSWAMAFSTSVSVVVNWVPQI